MGAAVWHRAHGGQRHRGAEAGRRHTPALPIVQEQHPRLFLDWAHPVERREHCRGQQGPELQPEREQHQPDGHRGVFDPAAHQRTAGRQHHAHEQAEGGRLGEPDSDQPAGLAGGQRQQRLWAAAQRAAQLRLPEPAQHRPAHQSQRVLSRHRQPVLEQPQQPHHQRPDAFHQRGQPELRGDALAERGLPPGPGYLHRPAQGHLRRDRRPCARGPDSGPVGVPQRAERRPDCDAEEG